MKCKNANPSEVSIQRGIIDLMYMKVIIVF